MVCFIVTGMVAVARSANLQPLCGSEHSLNGIVPPWKIPVSDDYVQGADFFDDCRLHTMLDGAAHICDKMCSDMLDRQEVQVSEEEMQALITTSQQAGIDGAYLPVISHSFPLFFTSCVDVEKLHLGVKGPCLHLDVNDVWRGEQDASP